MKPTWKETTYSLGGGESLHARVSGGSAGIAEVFRESMDSPGVWILIMGIGLRENEDAVFSVDQPGSYKIERPMDSGIHVQIADDQGRFGELLSDLEARPAHLLRIPRKYAGPLLVELEDIGISPAGITKKIRVKRRLTDVVQPRTACAMLSKEAGTGIQLQIPSATYVVAGKVVWIHVPPHPEGFFVVRSIEHKGAGAANVHLREIHETVADDLPHQDLILEIFTGTSTDVGGLMEQKALASLVRRNQSLGTIEDLV